MRHLFPWLLFFALAGAGCESETKIERDPASDSDGKKKKKRKKKKGGKGGGKKKKKRKKKNKGDEDAPPDKTAEPTPSADEETKEPSPKEPASPTPSGGNGVPDKLENPSIEMKDTTADGLTASSLACNGMIDMGYVMKTVGGLALQSKALNACASGREKVRVLYVMAAGKTTGVVVEAAKEPVRTCVKAAVEKVSSKMESTCLATLDLNAP